MTDVPDYAAGSPLLSSAYRFAREAHHGERRTGDTDVEHPIEVARLLHDAGFEDDVVAAALLHDVVEDSATGVEEIRQRFGAPVADLVAGMTEDESIEPYERRKAAHRDQVRGAGRDTAAIFAADKLANARDTASGASAADDAKLELRADTGHAERRASRPHLPRRSRARAPQAQTAPRPSGVRLLHTVEAAAP